MVEEGEDGLYGKRRKRRIEPSYEGERREGERKRGAGAGKVYERDREDAGGGES